MTKEDLQKQLQEAKKEAANRRDLFARVFTGEDGERLLAELVKMAPPAASSFSEWDEVGQRWVFDNDPIKAAWRDGRASIVAEIHGILRKAEHYHKKIT